MDKVVVEGLALECVIGVYDFEQQYPQRLYLDLELGLDSRPAAANDDLNKTHDYGAIAERLRQYAAETRVALIETLAEGMVDILRQEFSVSWMRMHLRKPGAVDDCRSVGILIERGED